MGEKKEERETLILLLINYKLHEIRNHSGLVPPESKAIKASSTGPNTRRMTNKC